jgi:hypothetical protein
VRQPPDQPRVVEKKQTPTSGTPHKEREQKQEVKKHSADDESRQVGKGKAPTVGAQEPKPSQPAAPDKDKPGAGRTEKKDEPPASPNEKKPAEKSTAASGSLSLTGVKFSVPPGWVKEEVKPSPMGPVAVYKIPKANGGDEGTVRITHYPNMKGKEMDDRNIDRWLGQVTKPDGSPMTRADAKITTSQVGPVRLTTVDMSGSVKMTMGDAAKPNYRMIATIVDHPQGPHFVVTGGPATSMEKWAAQIEGFLKSAKTE